MKFSALLAVAFTIASIGGLGRAADFTQSPVPVTVVFDHVNVLDSDNNVVKVVTAPTQDSVGQVVQYLADDQLLVCGSSGDCSVMTVPFNAQERAVIAGMADFSVRVCVNADAPGQPLWMFDKALWRVLAKPVKLSERWYLTLDLGFSWSPATEVSITRGAHHCNSVTWDSTTPGKVVAVMDNDTCDGDGQTIVLRGAATLRENDQQSFASAGQVVCAPFAVMTVLPTKRRSYQMLYGDALLSARQGIYVFGTALP